MKRFASSSLAVSAALLLLAGVARGAETGADARLCAVQEVLQCSPVTGCERVSAADVGLPDFLRVDAQGGSLRAGDAGDARQTSVRSKEVAAGSSILVGIEKRRGWSVVLADEGRRLTGTVAEGEGAFVVFGACTKE